MDNILKNLDTYNNIYKDKLIINEIKNQEPLSTNLNEQMLRIQHLRSFSLKDIEEDQESLEYCLKKININNIENENIIYIENENIKLYKTENTNNFYILKNIDNKHTIIPLEINNINIIKIELLEKLKINEIRYICSYLNIDTTYTKNQKISSYNKNSLIKIITKYYIP